MYLFHFIYLTGTLLKILLWFLFLLKLRKVSTNKFWALKKITSNNGFTQSATSIHQISSEEPSHTWVRVKHWYFLPQCKVGSKGLTCMLANLTILLEHAVSDPILLSGAFASLSCQAVKASALLNTLQHQVAIMHLAIWQRGRAWRLLQICVVLSFCACAINAVGNHVCCQSL